MLAWADIFIQNCTKCYRLSSFLAYFLYVICRQLHGLGNSRRYAVVWAFQKLLSALQTYDEAHFAFVSYFSGLASMLLPWKATVCYFWHNICGLCSNVCRHKPSVVSLLEFFFFFSRCAALTSTFSCCFLSKSWVILAPVTVIIGF